MSKNNLKAKKQVAIKYSETFETSEKAEYLKALAKKERRKYSKQLKETQGIKMLEKKLKTN